MQTTSVAEREPTLVVHFGIEKTGSTSIQRFLYHNRSSLEEKGARFASTHYARDNHINDVNHHILRHKWPGWLNPETFPITPDSAWDYLSEEVNSFNGTTIISSERFPDLFGEDNGADVVDFIKRRVAPARVHFVGFVRRQDNLAESHFKERAKGNDLTGTLEEYLARPPAFFDFNAMLERIAGVVGRDSLTVRLYDPALFSAGSVVPTFLQALGLGEISGQDADKVRENLSLNSLAVRVFADARLIAYHRHPEFNFVVREVLDSTRFSRFEKVRLVSPAQRLKIMNSYRTSNEALADNYLSNEEAARLLAPVQTEAEWLDLCSPALTLNDTVELLVALLGRTESAIAAARSAEAERESAIAAARSAEAERESAIAAARSAEAERESAIAAARSAEAERESAIAAARSAEAERESAIAATRSAEAERERLLRSGYAYLKAVFRHRQRGR